MARVRGVRVVLRGEVQHARAAHVLEQRLGTVGERAREEDALAQARPRSPRCPSKPPDSSTCCTTTAPARMMSPRAGLMPGTRRRSATVMPARRSTRSSSASRSMTVALHAELGHARARAAAPPRGCGSCRRCRRAARRPPATRRARACARRARAGAPSCLALAGPSSGRKRSVIRTAPRRQESRSLASRSRTRTSCSEPPPRSSTAPSRRSVELTAAR